MRRPVLYHFAHAFRNAGLKISRFQSGKGKQLGRTVKFGKIPEFRKDNGCRGHTDSRNGQHGWIKHEDAVVYQLLDFLHLALQWL